MILQCYPGLGHGRLRALLAAPAVLSGCGSDVGVRSSSFSASDSSGIEVLHSAQPQHGAETVWLSVAPEPDLQLGVVDGPAEQSFQSIRAAATLPDGRIALVDTRSYEIRIFDADGRYVRSIGRQGRGPGEFADDPFLAVQPPDTILAWDQVELRLTRFDAAGNILRQQSLAPAIQHLGIPRVPGATVTWRLRSDGTLLSPTGPLQFVSASGPHSGTQTPLLVRHRTDDAEVVPFGEFAVSRQVVVENAAGRRVTIASPWWPRAPMAFGGDPHVLAIAPDSTWEVRLFDADGALRRIIRTDVPRAPLTPAAFERERDRIAQRFNMPAAEVDRILRQLGTPGHMPAIAGLRWSTDGHLWVQRWMDDAAESSLHDIIDADGRWLGSVQVPAAAGRILEIGANHILTAVTDAMGVPFLRRYRLLRSS